MSALEDAAKTIETKGKDLLEGADPLTTAQTLIQAVHEAQMAQLSTGEAFALGSSPVLSANRLTFLNDYLQRDVAGAQGSSPTLRVDYERVGFGQKPTNLEIRRGEKEGSSKYAGASINLETGAVTLTTVVKP